MEWRTKGEAEQGLRKGRAFQGQVGESVLGEERIELPQGGDQLHIAQAGLAVQAFEAGQGCGRDVQAEAFDIGKHTAQHAVAQGPEGELVPVAHVRGQARGVFALLLGEGQEAESQGEGEFGGGFKHEGHDRGTKVFFGQFFLYDPAKNAGQADTILAPNAHRPGVFRECGART
jgi:hypothetical protein